MYYVFIIYNRVIEKKKKKTVSRDSVITALTALQYSFITNVGVINEKNKKNYTRT